jgi:hypothetical protein
MITHDLFHTLLGFPTLAPELFMKIFSFNGLNYFLLIFFFIFFLSMEATVVHPGRDISDV